MKASQHHNPRTRREVASSLQRIASDNHGLALTLVESLIEDEDSDTRVISTTFISSLVKTDFQLFIDKAKLAFDKGDERITKRIVDSAMREYLSIDSFDGAELLPLAWASSDQSTKSKIAGLMIQQSEANREAFIRTCERFREINDDTFNDVRTYILRRDSSMENKLEKSHD